VHRIGPHFRSHERNVSSRATRKTKPTRLTACCEPLTGCCQLDAAVVSSWPSAWLLTRRLEEPVAASRATAPPWHPRCVYPTFMTLRIDCLEGVKSVTIRIAGRLDEAGAGELRRICGDASLPLRLDLSEVRQVDQAGVEAIVALERAGAAVTGVPPYIAYQLKMTRQRGSRESRRGPPS
jgi:anti-anti-sigma regulatory factor